MPARSAQLRRLATGLAFLSPNILGVMLFTVLPIAFSVVLALTNWDLRRHNMFKDEPLQFVGLDNFVRLITEADFLRFLGNTLFLMMGIPFYVVGALMAALLLSKRPGGEGRARAWMLAATGLIISIALLSVIGMRASALTILLTGVGGGVLLMGAIGGVTVYRTLFYAPHFTAGVATYLLWKKLYAQDGPINEALQPALNVLAGAVNAAPASLVQSSGWACLGLMVLLLAWALRRARASWNDGDTGTSASIIAAPLLFIPVIVGFCWSATQHAAWLLAAAGGGILLWQLYRVVSRPRAFTSVAMEGIGSALVIAIGAMAGQFVLLGLSAVMQQLPTMAADGLSAPGWVHEYHWAKPSLMVMGMWGAIGSNNMLLYLAALTNVPQDLYEAADIDGAGRVARFWHVTWPQLAPTTFFILVMSTIGGLQGGFEMARTMTAGGPYGATTTLSYFIYLEGFDTGRLSFAAAVSWALFALVFSVTMFNWTFGNRYVNE